MIEECMVFGNQVIALIDIAVDAGTQVRVGSNDATVSEYAERMLAGDIFPPVVLFHDGSHYYMADGFHRLLATRRNGCLNIPAHVTVGTKQDALWYALGANKANGRPMSKDDRQHAASIALKTWPEKTQRAIADHVGCTQGLVSQVLNKFTNISTNTHEQKPRGRALAAKQKRDKVRELVLSGVAVGEIRRRLNAHPALVADVRKELGVSTIDRSPDAVKGREQRMRQMAADGFLSKQIASKLGMSLGGCRNAMRELEIDVPGDRAVGRTRNHDANRIVEAIVMDAENLTADIGLIAFSDIDSDRIGGWVECLKSSRDRLGVFVRKLEAERKRRVEAA